MVRQSQAPEFMEIYFQFWHNLLLLGSGVYGERAPKLVANTRDNMNDFHIGGICRSRTVIKYIIQK